ncbi:hypothetical protein, partial [Lacticaseibacillus rhamnosus]|uniref:hypothetical protein n=1 Tax=Lacticaseibacillus rhamnosus TaxID=47715 RepID=UPI003F46910A
HGGASLRVVGLVISVHVAGMYAASPVMGWLAERAGRLSALGVGVAMLAGAVLIAARTPADAYPPVAGALALLGLGWSACL